MNCNVYLYSECIFHWIFPNNLSQVMNFIKFKLFQILNVKKLKFFKFTHSLVKPSNTKTLQSFQYICLLLITFALWYVTNKNLHKDLNLPTQKLYSKFFQYSNPKTILCHSIHRRLKRQWFKDLHNSINLNLSGGTTGSLPIL